MPLVIVAIGVVLLLLLMIRFKMNGFIALVLVALAVGLMQGMPLVKVISSIKAGVGGTLGSLALISGFGTRLAALVLALFTLAASYFFHAFWAVPADQQYVTQLLFIKNIAVVGGLLTLAAWGAGAWSLDARRKH